MILDSVLDVVAAVLLVTGALFGLTAGIGLVRFPDLLTRMHAGTKPQVLGVLLSAVGVALAVRSAMVTGLLLVIVLLQVITAPVSAHMVSRVGYRRDNVRRDLLSFDQLAQATEALGRPSGTSGEDPPGDTPADAPPAASPT